MNGWPIVGWATFAVAAVVAAVLGIVGAGEPGIRMALRATARTSLAFFALAFVASALRRRWPSDATAWLMRNRRQLGVSFAVSHFVHLLLIFALVGWSWAAFRAATPTETRVMGGLAYGFIALMTVTSFDVTAAWLGPRAWRLLHVAGAYYLWIIFAQNYFAQAARSVFYWPYAAVLASAMALRWLPAPRAAGARVDLPRSRAVRS
ncbi:MAG: hypothetical protein IT294_05620 [Deltaproteobacteria bacterium]|nr:hypothetical protein [Deltaproteobacteria bacterium]